MSFILLVAFVLALVAALAYALWIRRGTVSGNFVLMGRRREEAVGSVRHICFPFPEKFPVVVKQNEIPFVYFPPGRWKMRAFRNEPRIRVELVDRSSGSVAFSGEQWILFMPEDGMSRVVFFPEEGECNCDVYFFGIPGVKAALISGNGNEKLLNLDCHKNRFVLALLVTPAVQNHFARLLHDD